MVRASDARSMPSHRQESLWAMSNSTQQYKSTAAQQLVLKYKKAVETEDFRDLFAYIDSILSLNIFRKHDSSA